MPPKSRLQPSVPLTLSWNETTRLKNYIVVFRSSPCFLCPFLAFVCDSALLHLCRFTADEDIPFASHTPLISNMRFFVLCWGILRFAYLEMQLRRQSSCFLSISSASVQKPQSKVSLWEFKYSNLEVELEANPRDLGLSRGLLTLLFSMQWLAVIEAFGTAESFEQD